jgi:glyoxylase I family protein
MPEIIGIDHIYLTVSDLDRSEKYYDVVMECIGFRKNQFQFGTEKHIQYFNRHVGVVLRPARDVGPHNPYAPGLHHLCLRVEDEKDVREVANRFKANGISVSEPRCYPEYAPDYYALFISDPDGIRLEITNFRQERRQRHDHWDSSAP